MADGYFPTLVSKDKDPNAAADPIYVQLTDGTAVLTTSGGSLSVLVANGAGGSAVNIQDGGNTITVDGSVGVSNGAGGAAVNIQDGGNSITVDGSVTVSATALDIRTITKASDSIQVSANSSVNSASNPIFVSMGSGPITGEIHAYDATSVGANTTGNQDYTVVTAMLVKSIKCASSGAAKFDLLTGPLASLVNKWTGLIPKQGGTIDVTFDPPIEVPVTSTGTVRVVRSNRENQAQSLYTTIVGIDA